MKSTAHGFTLVEVIIAVLVFTLTSLGMYGLTNTMLRMNDFSERVTSATRLAEDKIETLLGQGAAITPGSDTPDNFTRTWSVVTNARPYLSSVRVSVGWLNIDGRPQNITIDNLLWE